MALAVLMLKHAFDGRTQIAPPGESLGIEKPTKRSKKQNSGILTLVNAEGTVTSRAYFRHAERLP